ncbi:hypothetical protein KM872_13265 [Brevibacterium luteolum]|nr:M20/M25/M40 family metallo-hydrolase [Brevibacterium luteolum]MBU8579746.1 hypothetical protein [Brevibacterium luteolum]
MSGRPAPACADPPHLDRLAALQPGPVPAREENVDIEWSSKIPGRMHACGHDIHTASLVGALRMPAATS